MTPTEFDIRLREAMTTHNETALGVGFVRYEYLRTLTPRRFTELVKVANETRTPFDDLVDEAIQKGGFR